MNLLLFFKLAIFFLVGAFEATRLALVGCCCFEGGMGDCNTCRDMDESS